MLSYQEPILNTAGHTVGDFWQWAYSDILNNRNRSLFAEYLVGAALGIVAGSVREEWDGCDLRYADLRIEVKSSAYLQSWQQKKLYNPRFDIAHKRAWEADRNAFSESPLRYADCFVFCLFTPKEHASANVLDAAQWQFYVLPTALINQQFGQAKSLTLASLQRYTSALSYRDIKAALDALLK